MEEEKRSELGKTSDEDVMIEESKMQIFPTNGAHLSWNTEALGQIMCQNGVHVDSEFENGAIELKLFVGSCGFIPSQAHGIDSNQLTCHCKFKFNG